MEEKLKPRQMKALKVAKDEGGICVYGLMKNGWKSESTAREDLLNLQAKGFVKPMEKGERGKQSYSLAPGLYLASTSRPGVVPIPAVRTGSGNYSIAVKPLAHAPGTSLFCIICVPA